MLLRHHRRAAWMSLLGSGASLLGAGPSTAYAATPVSTAGLERTTAATSAGLPVKPQVPATCVTSKQNVLYTNVDEIFMAAYGWSGTHATVTQGATSTHTLGVAVKVGTGGWAASGSAGFSESQGSSATQSGIADAYVHNALNYRQYQTVCTGQLVRDTLRAESTYDYLSNFTFAPHINYATCVTKSAGAVVVKNTATDLTFGAGVSLPVELSVSAQSGWNTTTQATWKTTATTKLCGNSTTGWVNSSNISLSGG